MKALINNDLDGIRSLFFFKCKFVLYCEKLSIITIDYIFFEIGGILQ